MKLHSQRDLALCSLLALGACGGAGDDTGPAQEASVIEGPLGYSVADEAWGQLPDGRSYGAVSAIYPAPDGMSIWVAERCGTNVCVESDVDPVMRFDLEGNLMTSFGAGMIAWPHGMFVDDDGNVWVADAVGYAAVPAGWGHVIYKFSPDGEILMTLGERGVAGDGPDTFAKPSDLVVAPDGSIFVADGHDAGGNNRVVKLAADGSFIMEWGETGEEDGQFRDVHAMAMDSQGRLFVGDRANSRIQIFDQEGNHLETWTHFGRPSGLFIDGDDVLYAADSESNTGRNPGVMRGIYIGNALTGELTGLIPDPEPDPDNSGTSGAEGVAVDALGNVYGAEVGPRTVRKYERGPSPLMSFFLTGSGPGDGANLGGLEGADAYCGTLAAEVGAGDLTWRAYLSATATGSSAAVNARDRIGAGPWYNFAGVMVAQDVTQLHSDDNNLTKTTQLSERGFPINGRGDDPNRHDILTGSSLDGMALDTGDDTTCSNWTSNAEGGSAMVGHHDRQGGGANPTSWNAAHGSRGCGQTDLQGTGGDGLFYCFAVDGPGAGAARRD